MPTPEAADPAGAAERADRLRHGELRLHGRVMPASNATFVGEVDGTRVVYKPVAGERPLWDFPTGTLAWRELASWWVSEALGWDVVPPTLVREGPYGEGMVQVWQEPDPSQTAVDVVRPGRVPRGWHRVFDGLDARDQDVTLIHEDSAPLRRMAVFDVIVNNADRKGGHVLPMAGGHRYGVDHGLTFHTERKLRTVLWGWAGGRLPEGEVADVARVADEDQRLRDALPELLEPAEVEAFRQRCRRLVRDPRMPLPEGSWPAIPWPPF